MYVKHTAHIAVNFAPFDIDRVDQYLLHARKYLCFLLGIQGKCVIIYRDGIAEDPRHKPFLFSRY